MLASLRGALARRLAPTSSAALPPLPVTLCSRLPSDGGASFGPCELRRRSGMAAAAGPRIGTHDGTFHCDEALGCFLLRRTAKFAGASIARTRDQQLSLSRCREQVLDTLDAVLDVGGAYEPARDRFDHHQRGFEHCLGHGFATKLSSAGLVYKALALSLSSLLPLSSTSLFSTFLSCCDAPVTHRRPLPPPCELVARELALPLDHPHVSLVYLKLYQSFMEVTERHSSTTVVAAIADDRQRISRGGCAIDAVDNGINQYDTTATPRYANNTHLSARVGRLNPGWRSPPSRAAQDAAFARAMDLAGGEFQEALEYLAKDWLPARDTVEATLQTRHSVHASGRILKLEAFCPWKEHLHELEKELSVAPPILYVLYQDDTAGTWRVQAVA
eukprot:SM002457S08265  [mRNA]  locus=s2457:14:1763:+ [translate_table: standard]